MTLHPKDLARLAEYELSRRSFAEFVQAAIPHMNISTIVVWCWYLDTICDHLQAWVKGDIKKLLINVKNKSLKSKIAEVALPAWQWAQDPTRHWFTGAGSQDLALRFAWQGRQLIESDWYRGYIKQKDGSQLYELAGDQNVKRYYANSKGGSRFAAWPPMGTGSEGDLFLIDDPIGIEESYSNAQNETANRWVLQTLMSRFNDIKEARIAVLQHRVRRDDTSGALIERFGKDDLCILSLPLEYDPKKSIVNSLGWKDPRTEPGESLDPHRWGPKEIEFEKKTQGPKYQSVCNQDPQEDGLAIIDENWIKRWVHLPAQYEVVLSVDLSFKGLDPTLPKKKGEEEKRSKCCVQAWAITSSQAYLIDQDLRHANALEQPDMVRAMYDRWEPVRTYIEDAANGTAVTLQLTTGEPGRNNGLPGIIPVSPTRKGSKYQRLAAVSGFFRAGNIYVPPDHVGNWVKSFIETVTRFPSVQYDEEVDCVSQVLSEEWLPSSAKEKSKTQKVQEALALLG